MYFFPIIKLWTFNHVITFHLNREIGCIISALMLRVEDMLCNLRDEMSCTPHHFPWRYTSCLWRTPRALIYKYHLLSVSYWERNYHLNLPNKMFCWGAQRWNGPVFVGLEVKVGGLFLCLREAQPSPPKRARTDGQCI